MPLPHVFDLHCDTLDLLAMRDWEPWGSHGLHTGDAGYTDLAHNDCAVSLERMEDYAWCQCFAIWTPDSCRHRDARAFYEQARDFFYAQMRLHADRVEQVRDARRIDDVLRRGKVAAVLTVESARPVNRSVRAIGRLAEDGVKMATLTWNGRNALGSGNDTHDGMTAFGREAVRAFEDARIVVDVSHLNLEGFADFLDVARRPFVASHSNSRAVCDVPRNLLDAQFCAIRDAGGLVGVTYCTRFVAARPEGDARDVGFEELAAHIEHFLDLGGEDVLALGSDWDGAPVPAWLARCDGVGELARKLEKRFGEDLARKICFTNARDFFVRNETL
jgi:membrane dipeptidase